MTDPKEFERILDILPMDLKENIAANGYKKDPKGGAFAITTIEFDSFREHFFGTLKVAELFEKQTPALIERAAKLCLDSMRFVYDIYKDDLDESQRRHILDGIISVEKDLGKIFAEMN